MALAFAPTLFAGFLFDDYFNLLNATEAGWSWSRLCHGFVISGTLLNDGWQLPTFEAFVVRYFRPLFLASLLADHALWGLHPWGYHLTNVLLHLGVVAAFYGVLRELLGGQRRPAAYGALLFGVIHFHVPAVGWLSGRTELLPALAMMIALWSYLRFARRGRWPEYALSVAMSAIAFLAKENAAIFPLIALAAWLWVVSRPRPSFLWLLPYFALVAVYGLWRCHILGGFPLPPRSFYYHPPSEPGFIWWVLTKATFLFYNLIFQLPLMFPADLEIKRHPAVLIAMLLVAVAIAAWLFRLIRGNGNDEWRRRGYFAAAWIVIGLLPTAPLLINGLYCYFPTAGLTLLFLAIWSRLIERGRPRWLNRPRWRRATPILVPALFALGLQPGNMLLVLASRTGQRLLDEVAAKVGEPADGLRLYLVDLPAATYPIKSDLKLRWPDRRFEVHILSMSPYLLPGGPAVSRLDQPDARTLRLTTLGRPYLSGLFGFIVFSDGPRDDIKAGKVWPSPYYRTAITENELFGRPPRLCIRQIEFRFNEPLDSADSLFLRFSDGRFEKIAPR